MASIRSVNAGNHATGNVVVNKPAGAIDGDLVIVVIAMDDFGVAAPSPPDGTWTQDFFGSNNGISSFGVWHKVLSGDGSTWTFTTAATSAGCHASIAVQDVDGTTPVNQVSGTNTSSSTSHTTPSITPTVDGCLIISLYQADCSGGETPTWTQGSDNEDFDQADTASTVITISGYDVTQASAASISKTGTYTGAVAKAGYAAIYAIAPVAAPSAQQVYPDADVTTTGWTTTPLWSKIEETPASDTDFITATAA